MKNASHSCVVLQPAMNGSVAAAVAIATARSRSAHSAAAPRPDRSPGSATSEISVGTALMPADVLVAGSLLRPCEGPQYGTPPRNVSRPS